MNKYRQDSFCSRRCRSVEHADEIISAILRGNEDQAIAFMCWRCSNYGRISDEAGRTALHVASSCGKTKVLEWILKNTEYKTCLNARDSESGYTPLHRSLYHGQINCARILIKHGAELYAVDHDGLIPFDHVIKDQVHIQQLSTDFPSEVYVWGSNSNFNLGIGSHQIRRFPDTIDYFRKNNISIKKVAMGKFHSIFICHDGRAFSCGHGKGGRLGLDAEETVMTPNQISLPSHHIAARFTDIKHVIVNASVGQDHSMLVTEKGIVYTFGMNEHKQLGHDPPPPFLVSPKALPIHLEKSFGIYAAHYHSVAWDLDRLYTWGLNCGQHGQYCKSKWVIKPQLVRDLSGVILAVGAGDGVTVVATSRKYIYLLQDHCVRRIGISFGRVCRIEISGGRLDPTLIKSEDVSGWGDYRSGEDDLKVVLLDSSKKVALWQSSTQRMIKCKFHVGNRYVNVVDAALGMNKLLVVTDEGEGFETELITKQNSPSPKEKTPLQKLIDKDPSVHFHLKRISFIHRAVSVFCDPKGCNFSFIQVHHNIFTSKPEKVNSHSLESGLLCLLEEASEDDFLSDVVFCVDNTRIPAHRYILEENSKCFADIIASAESSLQLSSLKSADSVVDENFHPKTSDILTIKLDDVHPLIFKEILKFVYTGMCDFCISDDWTPEKDLMYSSRSNENKIIDENNVNSNRVENVDKHPTKEKSSIESPSVKVKPEVTHYVNPHNNPITNARRAAIRFGLGNMVKQMEGLHYNKNKCAALRKLSRITESQDVRLAGNISLNPNSCCHLYDVVIECDEGKNIKAHKCILAARSKYFEAILKGNWLECSGKKNLSLPVSYEVMESILFYLYQNKVPILKKSEDLTFLCNVLIAADQILLEGLKELCEISLAKHVTLKNISYLYQMSDTYNASKLRNFCIRYICQNLTALLESRALDSISDELFDDIQLCYWENTPVVLDRHIAPPSKYPDLAVLQSVLEDFDIPPEEEHFKHSDYMGKSSPRKEGTEISKKNKSKRKPRSKHNSTDEYVESFQRISLSSTPGSGIEMSSERLDLSDGSPCIENIEYFDDAIQLCHQETSERDELQLDLELKLEGSHSTPVRSHTSSTLNPKSESNTNSIKNEEFPSLTGDFHQTVSPHSAKIPKQRKVAKLSQKARKKLLSMPEVTDESVDNQMDISKPEGNPWKKMGINIQEDMPQNSIPVMTLSEIMNEERMRRPVAKTPYTAEFNAEDKESVSKTLETSLKTKSKEWPTRQSSNECPPEGQQSFNDIIADELKQKEITKKIIGKSLNLTQIEDKAIKELQFLYEAEYEFDEHITVKRHCSAQASKPIWINSKNL